MANYNEGTNGDLSSTFSSPTPIALSAGNNIITGGTTPADLDFFTFTVPVGSTVSAITLQNYTGPDGSYFAIDDVGAFANTSSDAGFVVSTLIDDGRLLGGVQQPSEVGQDLLAPGVGNNPSQPANPPAITGPGQLGPGTYSVWYQELAGNTTYEFNVVLDTPPPPAPGQIQFSSNAFNVNEAAGTIDITLTRTGGSTGAVSVQLNSLAGGTAQNGTDYSLPASPPLTVNFADGVTSQVVSVAITDDAIVEGNETALFELSNPTGGATLGTTTQSTLTIADNDTPPLAGQIQFSANAYEVNEAAGTIDITLTRTGGSTGAASVVLNQTGGTAQSGTDYTLATPTPLTVNFAAGQTEQVVSVGIVDDILDEENETLLFELSNPTGGATLGTTTQSTLTITDSDEIFRGTGDSDTLVGGVGDDRIIGGGNDDRLIGGDGNDRILGGSDDDRLFGGNGNDRLVGGSGDDRLAGNDGNDFLIGGGGDDTLLGGAGNDRILGGSGDDVVDGGLGTDNVIGGAGRDTFVLRRGNGPDLIRDFRIDEDSLDLRGDLRFGALTFTQERNQTLISVGGDELAVLQGVRANQLNAEQFS